MTLDTLTLTSSQQAAVDGALAVLNRGEGVYKIGGYAGTGKTTLARAIFETVPGGMPCSLTGKAACRLIVLDDPKSGLAVSVRQFLADRKAQKEAARISALRGVITRLKRKVHP